MKKIFSIAALVMLVFSGCSKKDQAAADISVPAPLSAGFSVIDANSAKEGTAIQFQNTSVSGTIFKWDFGNGKTSTERNPSFTYPICGIYHVQLFVTDAKGNATSISQELIVNCIFRAPGQPPVTHPPLF